MRRQGVHFSDIETSDLFKAWIATSLAFGIFFLVTDQSLTNVNFTHFLLLIGLAAVTAGVGFIGHELMHKFTANHFGVHAEFRSNDSMLVISIIIAFLGIIFAAPGAVQIYGNITRRENGLISAAGPAANLVLAALFFPLLFSTNTFVHKIGSTGLLVNALLGVFNLIPLGDFDGAKVLRWHKGWYFFMLLMGGILVVAAFAYTGLAY